MITSKDSPVGLFERGIAYLVDFAFVIAFVFLFNLFIDFHFALTLVIFTLLYDFTLPLCWNGYTIGKRMVGIRIAQQNDEKLTFFTMLIRVFVTHVLYYGTAGLLTIISIVCVAVRDDRKAIHDFLAQTYVTSNAPNVNKQETKSNVLSY